MPKQHALPVKQRKIAPSYAEKPTDIDGVAEYFDVSIRTVKNWVAEGVIPFIRIRRCLRFKIKDIERLNTFK